MYKFLRQVGIDYGSKDFGTPVRIQLFSMNEEPEIKTVVLLSCLKDPTSEAWNLNENKKDLFNMLNSNVKQEAACKALTKPEYLECGAKNNDNGETNTMAIVKEESLSQIQIKSEIPDIEISTSYYHDDIIKSELSPEELNIKPEIFIDHEDQAIKALIKNKLSQHSLTSSRSTEKRDLHRHMLPHIDDKRFNCSICSYTSIQKHKLDLHMEIHTTEKSFKCNTCGYVAVRRHTLERHLKTHAEKTPFTCSVCGYATEWKKNLKGHMETHTGEKPHKCVVCGYASKHKHNLELHMKIHTGVKPYKCNMCGYETVRKHYLNRHVKIHTGEKPYKCNVCGYANIQRYRLVRHMKTHSGEI